MDALADLDGCALFAEIDIFGRFYHSDYGYVDLTTTTSILTFDGDEYPSSGQLILTGKSGSAGGPSSARLTALDQTHCQVEADTNGDGTFDYDSGLILWTALQ